MAFQHLRQKFIFVAMTSVAIVLFGILAFVNILYFLDINTNANQVLEYMADHGGIFPETSDYSGLGSHFSFYAETPYQSRYFTVTVDTREDLTMINMGHVAAIQPSQAYNYAIEVKNRGNKTGYFQGYKYLVSTIPTGYQIIFLDVNTNLDNLFVLILSSVFIFCVSILIIFILLSIFSKPIIEPVVDNINKQKQFIADASHEIKTPLAIISADTDVIEIENGKDEWTRSIKEQVKRLSSLIQDMLTLSKMEGDIPKNLITQFDLSKVVQNTAEEFTPIAVSEEKNYIINIVSGIFFTGDKEGIKQLVSVLLNNAFKYTNEYGYIELKVYKKGRSVFIDLINTTDHLPEGDLKKLFNRFYRADKSRSRETGSFGIGLSIAQAITQQHKGQIAAKKLDEHTIMFRVILNNLKLSK